MKIAHIGPISQLDLVEEYSDFFLAEAEFVLKSEVLTSFYRRMSESNHLVILDNGIWYAGDPLPTADLVEAAERIKATFIMAPDKIDDYKVTAQRTEEFISETLFPRSQIIGVIQGSSMEEKFRCIDHFCELGLRLSLPANDTPEVAHLDNSTLDSGTRIMLKRMFVLDQLEQVGYGSYFKESDKLLFLTGLGNPIEVAINSRSWIYGADSSACFQCGRNNVLFSRQFGCERPQVKLDFSEKFDTEARMRTRFNLQIMNFWLNRKSKGGELKC